MRAFAIKTLLFLLPFILIISIEIYVDPFNFFSAEKNEKLLAIKSNISGKDNPYLYKLIEYDRNPGTIILLGDSRTGLLFPSLFDSSLHNQVSNLSIGGGTLQDAFEIFRYVIGKHKISKVFMGIAIETYSGTLLRNRAKPSIEIKNSVLLYLLNRYTFTSTMLVSRSYLFNEQIDLYKPPESRDEFWQSQLELSSRYLDNYSYPENYYEELKKLSDYCLANNIHLSFILSPTHVDLQKKIHEHHLDKEYAHFKNDIQEFGDVYDFNYPNEITTDKSNFGDPYHHTIHISQIIVDEISGKKIKYARFSPRIGSTEKQAEKK